MSKRFVRFVRSFHTLTSAPGVTEGNVDLDMLDMWAAGDPNIYTPERGPFPGDGCKNAARFVLNMWDSRKPWRVGPFNVFHALATWDNEQLIAWQAWAISPWRP